jgi:hypothetical protein
VDAAAVPPPSSDGAAVAAENPTPAVATAVSAPSPPPPASKSRSPSINFLGKDGWARARSGGGGGDDHQDAGTVVVYEIPANYGRLQFTEEEMEALVMGGANMAPDIKQYSGGARFST